MAKANTRQQHYLSFCTKYNEFEEAIKKIQLVQGQINFVPVNEARYACRALVEAIQHDLAADKNEEEFINAIKRAEHACRCGFDDCVDITVAFCVKSLQEISQQFPLVSISEVWPQYIEKRPLLDRLQQAISASRKERRKRFENYQEMFNSDDFDGALEIAKHLPIVREEIAIKAASQDKSTEHRKRMQKTTIVSVTVAIVSMIVALIGLL